MREVVIVSGRGDNDDGEESDVLSRRDHTLHEHSQPYTGVGTRPPVGPSSIARFLKPFSQGGAARTQLHSEDVAPVARPTVLR